MSNAPTFNDARSSLVETMSVFQFTQLSRPVKTTPTGYFGLTRLKLLQGGSGVEVYFNDRSRAQQDVAIGPLTLHPQIEAPVVGDVLMGVVVPTNGNTHKPRLTRWYSGCTALYELARIARCGTREAELDIAHRLRMGDYHDAWALARLVLFGNVTVFAHLHLNTTPPHTLVMRLSVPALEFVYRVADTLGDMSIWRAFARLVPGAIAPTPPVVLPYVPRLAYRPPEQLAYDPEQLAYDPERAAYDPERPAYDANERAYDPEKPIYNPASPTYNPASPTYNPASPTYNPASPTYNPATYNPASPTYNPATYNPASPTYNPATYNPATYNPTSPTYNPATYNPTSPTYNPATYNPAMHVPPSSPLDPVRQEEITSLLNRLYRK